MMRSLYTAATGMTAQQMNIDTIANNLSNVNTYGYKKERMEFKTLMYETMQRTDLDPANQTGRPVNLQVGQGVRVSAISRIFTMGSLQRTDNPVDFALEGPGFFEVRYTLDQMLYTRDGSFKLMPDGEDGLVLTTSDGYPIMSVDDEPIVFPVSIPFDEITMDERGNFYYGNENGEIEEVGAQLKIVQFANSKGLDGFGSNLLQITSASGPALVEALDETGTRTRVVQSFLEMSNVQVAEEMVNMIVAQRAYELNSKAITTSDSMLETANNLKR